MELFQAQRGFAHLVFANQKDSYILPGLVRMNLNGYLYYLLKKQGYRSVFFVSGLETPFCLEVYDDTSRDLYLRNGRKNNGFWGKFAQEEQENAREYDLSDDLPKRFTNLLKKSKDAAFVFRLDTFHEIFHKDRTQLKEYIRTGQRYLEQNGSILLLQMPLTANGSLGYLTDSKGIFAEMDGVSLCPEVCLIMGQNQNVRIYEQLARDMGERCVFLNQATEEKIRLIVTAAFMNDPELTWNEKDLEEMTAFVYAWHTSCRFRQEIGPVLTENEDRRFWKLFCELTNPTIRWKLRQKIQSLDTLDQPLSRFLREQYPPDVNQPLILSEDDLAKKIKRVQIPEDLYSSTPELGKVILTKFRELVMEYQIPRSRPCDKALKDLLLEECLEPLQKAANNGDIETFDQAVKLLEFCAERDFRYDQLEQRSCRIRIAIVKLSGKLFDLDQRIREDIEWIAMMERKKLKLHALIKEEQAKLVTGITNGISAQEHALSTKQGEFVSLARAIDQRLHAKATKEDAKAMQQASLYNLEMALGNLGMDMGLDVEDVLREAMEIMERDAIHHQRSESTLQEITDSMDLIMRETQSQSSEEDLMAEYEKIISSMEEEPLILLD